MARVSGPVVLRRPGPGPDRHMRFDGVRYLVSGFCPMVWSCPSTRRRLHLLPSYPSMRSISLQSRNLGSVSSSIYASSSSVAAPRAFSTAARTSAPSSFTSARRPTASRSAAYFQPTPRSNLLARTFATTMPSASRIKVQNPIVEMDGDEMTVSRRMIIH